MARRSHIGIRKAGVRLDNYRAGIQVGDVKYAAKVELMKKRKDAAFYVISQIQDVAKDAANRYGISGTLRTVLVKVAERLGSEAVRYANMDDRNVRALLEGMVPSELATSGIIRGVTVPDDVYNAITTAINDIIDRIVAMRRDLLNKYVELITS